MFHRFLALVWAAIVVGGGCQKPESVELPPKFEGVWTTQASAYADRFFELRGDDTIRFGLGNGRVDVSPIVRVEVHREGRFLVYRIVHLNDSGDEYALSVLHDPQKSRELTFLNQPRIVWRKEHEPGSGAERGRGRNTEVKK